MKFSTALLTKYSMQKIAQTVDPSTMSKEEYFAHVFPGKTPSQVIEEDYSLYSKMRKDWDRAMQKALSTGKISPEEAEERGYYFELGRGALPDVPLYHVTTAKDKIISEGLKTREELSQSYGAGLGGGASNTISFTTDLDTARGILSNMKEARAYARGELTFEDLVKMAKEGHNANRPWYKEWMSYYGSKEGEIPEGVQYTLEGYDVHNSGLPRDAETMAKEGWEPIPESKWPHGKGNLYTRWKKKSEKLLDDKFQLFKSWSLFRDSAGGPLDPLYFASDPEKLSSTAESDLAILEFRAKPKAYGHQLSGLGEWRTYSGDAVEFVQEVI